MKLRHPCKALIQITCSHTLHTQPTHTPTHTHTDACTRVRASRSSFIHNPALCNPGFTDLGFFFVLFGLVCFFFLLLFLVLLLGTPLLHLPSRANSNNKKTLEIIYNVNWSERLVISAPAWRWIMANWSALCSHLPRSSGIFDEASFLDCIAKNLPVEAFFLPRSSHLYLPAFPRVVFFLFFYSFFFPIFRWVRFLFCFPCVFARLRCIIHRSIALHLPPARSLFSDLKHWFIVGYIQLAENRHRKPAFASINNSAAPIQSS